MRNIPDPGFAGDAGGVDETLAAALASYADNPGELHNRTLALLQTARLLVPVLALAGEGQRDGQGLAQEKTSEMATVLMRGRDGRMALLAFSNTDSMRAWNPEARPVPVAAAQVAQAALHDDASALVLDVAGPVKFVVEEGDLRPLADGHTLVEINGAYGWVGAAR